MGTSDIGGHARRLPPLAAIGIVFVLSSGIYDKNKNLVPKIKDLLAKLGQEDDAYHAVMLIMPNCRGLQSEQPVDPLELASESGISRVHFQRIEQGVLSGTPANPSLRTFSQIAAALSVSCRDLLPPAALISRGFPTQTQSRARFRRQKFNTDRPGHPRTLRYG